jgi:hypothetical protein
VAEDRNEILRDIRKWVKIIGIQQAKPALVEALSSDDDEKERNLRITYHLTDGEHTTRDIDDHISYSRYWISSRYDEWSNMGVIERDGSKSPYEHVISLEEAGIEVPKIPKPDDGSDDSDGSSDGNETEEMTESESTEEDTAEAAELGDYE